MPACPVCGEAYEYRAEPDGATTTLAVDELCALDADTRWNRICPAAVEDEGRAQDGGGVTLYVYHHHFGEGGPDDAEDG